MPCCGSTRTRSTGRWITLNDCSSRAGVTPSRVVYPVSRPVCAVTHRYCCYSTCLMPAGCVNSYQELVLDPAHRGAPAR